MIRQLLIDEWRFLTFRRMSDAIRHRGGTYLAFGLVFAWLAGIGRYWDNPKAELWQHIGLGSVIYVFVLAAILWVLLLPLRPRAGSYTSVAIFVALTSPPAVLYAIPVERFLSADLARATNAWFLGVVAAWRVGLYGVYLRRVARLPTFELIVAILLPLALIVCVLSLLNLEHVVFDLMAGTPAEDRGPNDAAYRVVVTLSIFSFVSAPVLLIAYFIAAVRASRRGRRPGPSAADEPDEAQG